MKYIFFRNDDVRETLDITLVDLTNIFIREGVPITHVVEPANITAEVISWLKKLKEEYPQIIEIGQHGYDHRLKAQKMIFGKLRKGEFGYGRSYEEQLTEIESGKQIMDATFGDSWVSLFTFPFGGKNLDAIRAVDDCGYKIMNDHHKLDWNHKLFYFTGRLLRRNFLFERPVSYNLKKRPQTNLFNININISLIKKYINDETECVMYSLDELKALTKMYLREKTIGIVLHHRYHNDRDKMQLVTDYINWLKTINGVQFVNQQTIYEKYCNR
jgi:hypothetical protein